MAFKAIFQLQLIDAPEGGDAKIDLNLGLQGEGATINAAVLDGLVQIKKITDAISPQVTH
jgi:hypothetical protein